MTLTVLHAIPTLVGGGAERQLSLLAPQLSRLGVDTHVAYLHGGVNLAPLQAAPVGLHPLTCRGNHDPRILLKLVRLIRTLRPDVVQTWLPQMDIMAGIAALMTGTPFVLSERSSSAAYPGGWKNRLRWHIGQRADVVVGNSQGGVDYWGAVNGVRRVIRNGLVLRAIRASEAASTSSLGLPEHARLVLFAGRLSAEKNIPALLQALDVVLDRHADVVAVLFGEGPLHAALQAQVTTLAACDRVRLVGYTPELWRWMRRASAFVSVSHFEGNPNTVLEAAALGCPLVVSSIAQHREILDDASARFCELASPADIARAIDDVLEEPAAAAGRAAAARCLADAWSIENAAQGYLNLYRELSSRRLPTKRSAQP